MSMLMRARIDAALVYMRITGGLLQQRLDPAHTGEFDAKDPDDILKDDGKRRLSGLVSISR